MERQTKPPTVSAARLMTRPVHTVRLLDSIHHVAEMFSSLSISAAVVMDGNRRPVGVITKTDLVRFEAQRDGIRTVYKKIQKIDDEDPIDSAANGIDGEETVERWMTPVIFSVPPETSAAVMAKRMVKYGTHHIFVRGRDQDDVQGIVSSFDLLRVLADEK